MVDIWWFGQACFKVKGKAASCVIDPYSAQFTGLSQLKLDSDIVCVTHGHEDHNNISSVRGSAEKESPFVISGPGEYEISGVGIVGVSSFHDDSQGKERGANTIYSITIDEVNIVHLGDLGQKKLDQSQVEVLSSCDVLLIPVGGTYTIDAKDAPDIIAQLEPKIVVPMHYKIDGLKFPLSVVDKFLTSIGKEDIKPVAKLSVSQDKMPMEMEVVLLEVSK